MGKFTKLTLLLAAGGLSTAAIAQQSDAPESAAPPAAQPEAAEPAAPAPTDPAATPATVSDAEVKQFASAIMAMETIQNDTTLADADKQQAMISKVQEQGLDPQRFNEIGQAAQSDPALQQRIQAEVAALQSAGTSSPAEAPVSEGPATEAPVTEAPAASDASTAADANASSSAPPPEAMNKTYPTCTSEIQDSCRNPGGR